jgi:hypothetical protein
MSRWPAYYKEKDAAELRVEMDKIEHQQIVLLWQSRHKRRANCSGATDEHSTSLRKCCKRLKFRMRNNWNLCFFPALVHKHICTLSDTERALETQVKT